MSKGRDLLDHRPLINTHPDLEATFFSLPVLLGEIVFAQRMKLGYTQKELAEKANVSIDVIAGVEGGGNHDLKIKLYEQLFNVLDINNQRMTDFLINKSEVVIRVKDVMTSEELALFDELNQLILTSVTSRERQFYNVEVAQLVEQVKERYVKEKERDHS